MTEKWKWSIDLDIPNNTGYSGEGHRAIWDALEVFEDYTQSVMWDGRPPDEVWELGYFYGLIAGRLFEHYEMDPTLNYYSARVPGIDISIYVKRIK